MIASQVVFPIKIASTYAPKGLLGEDFDIELQDILSQVPDNRKLASGKGEVISTLRVLTDVMLLPTVKKFNEWTKTVIPILWEEIGFAPSQLAVERSWINRFNKGSCLRPHAHGSTEMVMTYYHKVPKGSSTITFYNPFDVSTGMAPFKDKTLTFTPEEGLLLAWPGFLWHEVNESEVDDGRIAISMHVHQGSYTLADRWRVSN